MAVTRLIVAMAVVCSAANSACEGVPTLTFAQADAAQNSVADAAEVNRDAPDAVSDVLDAGAVDAPPVESGDSSAADGCPGPNPPLAAYVCCGAVVCEGLCTGRCDACAKCTSPGTFCCAKNNSIQCLSAGMICHP
jgi:hypothetical protein